MTPHAHRPTPDRIEPRDVAGFLVLAVMGVVLLVLGLAMGPVPGW